MSNADEQASTFDRRYYRDTGTMDFARRISAVARRRVHELFLQTMRPRPTDRILDVGASDDTGPDANMLEQLYPWRHKLTCVSLSDGQRILAAYPGVRHVRIAAGAPLPFDRHAFDIVYCTAVLEHGGSPLRQREFVADLCRVAPRRFVTVPNRAFPIEPHTCLPLVHWLPQRWFRRLLRGTRYDFWSHEENLNYVSASDLRTLWPDPSRSTVLFSGIGFGSCKSNLVIYQT